MIESKHMEVVLDGVKFIAEYNPNNALVLSISLNILNCKDYLSDKDYDILYEEGQEIVSMIVE